MGKKVRSMRGEIIDWDLAAIKTQMKSKPAPANVKQRQDFIDSRVRRRAKKIKGQLDQLSSTKVERKVASAPVEEQEKINDTPAVQDTAVVEETQATEETKSTAPKRSVRRKSSTKKTTTSEE